jgi:hypothetical protein
MKNNGGPAFPRPLGHHPHMGCTYSDAQQGMSLRDYFAGHALAGLLSDETIERVTPEGYAKSAYDYAEAMIEERTKRNV